MDIVALKSFTIACLNNKGKFDDIPEVINFADTLGICKILVIVHNEGKEINSFYLFGENKPDGGDSFNYSKEYNDDTAIVIKMQRYPDAYPLSEEEKNLLDVFMEVIIMTVYGRYLSKLVIKNKYYDELTGIPNTAYFYRHLAKKISDGSIGEYTAAFINMINCHTMNLLFGHEATNGLFRSFTEKITQMLNPDDDEVMARVGGDNFCILVKTSKQKDFFNSIKSIDTKTSHNGEDIFYSISIREGIAILDDTIPNYSTIMSMISSALAFCRKDASRTQVYYSKNYNNIDTTPDNLPNQMIADLEKGRFLVYYQPVYRADGSSLHLAGAEALIRWRRPDGMMNPDDFMEIAEKNGIITKIDFYVINTVCSRIKEWLDEGLNPPPVSCNLSGSHLADKSVGDAIISIIDSHGIDHKYIQLEFSEAAFMANPEALKYVMAQLINAGIEVIIDEFGSGYFSMSLLHELNFKYLKITRKLLENPNDRAVIIIKEVIHLAKSLGITVICEGVPSLAEIDLLVDSGCTLFQTELFEKAISERFYRNKIITERN